METITIRLSDTESAREMMSALSGFEAELVELPDGHVVVITLEGGDGEMSGVLNALQHYLTQRAGPRSEQLDFAGHSYFLHDPGPGGL
jgi:hypothetical protein